MELCVAVYRNPNYILNYTIFEKKSLTIIYIYIFCAFLFDIFLIIRKNQRGVKNVRESSCKASLIFKVDTPLSGRTTI